MTKLAKQTGYKLARITTDAVEVNTMERFTNVIKRGDGTVVDVKMCDPNKGETWKERFYDHEKNYNAFMQLAKYEVLDETCIKEANCTLEELLTKYINYLSLIPPVERERLLKGNWNIEEPKNKEN